MRTDSRDLLWGLGFPYTHFQRKRLSLPELFILVCKTYIQPGVRETPGLFYPLGMRVLALLSQLCVEAWSILSPQTWLLWSRTLTLYLEEVEGMAEEGRNSDPG